MRAPTEPHTAVSLEVRALVPRPCRQHAPPSGPSAPAWSPVRTGTGCGCVPLSARVLAEPSLLKRVPLATRGRLLAAEPLLPTRVWLARPCLAACPAASSAESFPPLSSFSPRQNAAPGRSARLRERCLPSREPGRGEAHGKTTTSSTAAPSPEGRTSWPRGSLREGLVDPPCVSPRATGFLLRARQKLFPLVGAEQISRKNEIIDTLLSTCVFLSPRCNVLHVPTSYTFQSRSPGAAAGFPRARSSAASSESSRKEARCVYSTFNSNRKTKTMKMLQKSSYICLEKYSATIRNGNYLNPTDYGKRSYRTHIRTKDRGAREGQGSAGISRNVP